MQISSGVHVVPNIASIEVLASKHAFEVSEQSLLITTIPMYYNP